MGSGILTRGGARAEGWVNRWFQIKNIILESVDS